jgi:hypothetical protein
MSCIGGAPDEADLSISIRLALMTASPSSSEPQLRAAETSPPEPLLSNSPTTRTMMQTRKSTAPMPYAMNALIGGNTPICTPTRPAATSAAPMPASQLPIRHQRVPRGFLLSVIVLPRCSNARTLAY